MLVPDARQMLPPEWRPPTPFTVLVRHWGAGRTSDILWTMPWLLGADGRVVMYVACGPAGKPARLNAAAGISMRSLPRGANVQIALEHDPSGQVVYARPQHTPN